MQVFRWPARGLHRDRFLVIVHSAIWHTLDRLTVNVAVVPFVKIMTFDPRAIINTFGEVNVYSGTAKKAPNDDDNPELAFKLALNRAIRKALGAISETNVWDETYHPKRRQRTPYCIRINGSELRVFTSNSGGDQLSLPGNKHGFAPIADLDPIVAHAVAQHAPIDVEVRFRNNLTLHYGKTNTVDGREGWTMTHCWLKPTGEGEPDDFGLDEKVFFDAEEAATRFSLRAKELLNI